MKSLSILILLGTVTAIVLGGLFAVSPVLAEASTEPVSQPVAAQVQPIEPVAPTTGRISDAATAAAEASISTAPGADESISAVTQQDNTQAPEAATLDSGGEALSATFSVSFEKEAAPQVEVAQAVDAAQPAQSVAAVAASSLDSLIESVSNGKASQLRGIYVDGVLAFAVGQQPGGNASYVSENFNEVTQFGLASQYGSTGILAHNYLAGSTFFNLSTGQTISLVFGDGSMQEFTIQSIQRYQALSPNSTQSQFVDLENANTLSATKLFHKIYNNSNSLVLQTCIANEGISTWGRIFIVAVPA